MNSINWIIELPNGTQDVVQCDVCGVSPDGSLLCFVVNSVQPQSQPQIIKGFAPGQWNKFYRSSLRSN